MSLKTRREIASWYMQLIGMGVTAIQFYRYATNTLSYSNQEAIITVISVSFMIFPRFILNVAEKILTKKNENNGQ